MTAHLRFRNVSWLDAGIALVAVATVPASYLPARRATRVDPSRRYAWTSEASRYTESPLT
jgi:hypothetical protein